MAKSTRMSSSTVASLRSREAQLPSAWPPARCASARLVLRKVTDRPRRQARWPRAWAMWLLPTPTGPCRTTDSPRARERRGRPARVGEAQGREVADRGDGQVGRDGEVEVLQGDLLVEPGGLQPPADRGGGPP